MFTGISVSTYDIRNILFSYRGRPKFYYMESINKINNIVAIDNHKTGHHSDDKIIHL